MSNKERQLSLDLKYYIGIDPGQKGGIVVLDSLGNFIYHFEMPMDSLGLGFDTRTFILNIRKLFKPLDGKQNVVVITEKIHAMFGVGANATFSLGMAFQNVLSAIQILQYPSHTIAPTVWTKAMWAGLKEIRKAPKKGKEVTNKDGTKKKTKMDSKAMSLQCIEKLNPIFLKNVATGVKGGIKDGLIDAYLLAEYARRNNL